MHVYCVGYRNCIGQQFAMHELKVTVAHVLNRLVHYCSYVCKYIAYFTMKLYS